MAAQVQGAAAAAVLLRAVFCNALVVSNDSCSAQVSRHNALLPRRNCRVRPISLPAEHVQLYEATGGGSLCDVQIFVTAAAGRNTLLKLRNQMIEPIKHERVQTWRCEGLRTLF